MPEPALLSGFEVRTEAGLPVLALRTPMWRADFVMEPATADAMAAALWQLGVVPDDAPRH